MLSAGDRACCFLILFTKTAKPYEIFASIRYLSSSLLVYGVYQKKLNRFEIALNFTKQLLVSSF
jgi:hypothetical protein